MTQLRQVNNKKLLQELKLRLEKKEISEREVFTSLENPPKTEVITEYKKMNWGKVCQTLERSKNYQEEVKIWESIDGE